ncbi:class I SAM-dependent methyltransferase [Streptomyces sp. NPDC050147]|uniref:class I SAM-dependent methyltransferase n=1 Tax=Streptomyces sp. NPDC050147 TaxID=3155513 RepID=UPI003433E4CE
MVDSKQLSARARARQAPPKDSFRLGEQLCAHPDDGAAADERAPWDIGRVQPAVIEWDREGTIRGDVLDAGCGFGENAAFLASRGHRVTGVDSSPEAIDRARELMRERGLDVTFTIADLTELSGCDGRFETVVDSALFHCLDQEERSRYLRALHRATAPGAHLHLLCFSDALPRGNPELFRIGARELRDSLKAEGWESCELRRGTLLGCVPSDELREIYLRRFSPDGGADAYGVVHSPAWWARARRV